MSSLDELVWHGLDNFVSLANDWLGELGKSRATSAWSMTRAAPFSPLLFPSTVFPEPICGMEGGSLAKRRTGRAALDTTHFYTRTYGHAIASHMDSRH